MRRSKVPEHDARRLKSVATGLGIDALNAEWAAADIYNENGTE